MKSAIANYRALEAIIHEMQEITQNLILRAPEIPEKAQQKKCPKPALP
jgi:hypothetical protein